MKCQEVSVLLEEYFDGELAERQRANIAAHLNACVACAQAYEELQREQDLFMRYERDVEVTPQLWLGVQARLAAEQQTEAARTSVPLIERARRFVAATLTVPRFSPALTAALVLVAIALTVGAMRFMQPRESHAIAAAQSSTTAPQAIQSPTARLSAPSPQSSVEQPTPEQHDQVLAADKPNSDKPRRDEGLKDEVKERKSLTTGNGPRIQLASGTTNPKEQTPDALVRDAEAKYLKAIQILARDVNKRRANFDPETLARFDETLNAIDRTIAETRRAALGQGNDPVAVQYMLTAYAKKVEVLREMARN